MKRARAALGLAFAQVWRYLGTMVLANVTAIVLMLPILVVLVFVAALLRTYSVVAPALIIAIGVLPSPSNAGVQYIAHETANRNPLLWRDQVDGFRRYGLLALRTWLLSVAVTILLLGNAIFYSRLSFIGARVIEIGCVLGLIFWLALHLYVYPLLLEQEVKRVLLVYRNAALITVAQPLATVVVVLVWLVVLVAASFTGVIGVVGLALCAAIQQNAAAVLLPAFDRPTN